jgi:hypothetical protein
MRLSGAGFGAELEERPVVCPSKAIAALAISNG